MAVPLLRGLRAGFCNGGAGFCNAGFQFKRRTEGIEKKLLPEYAAGAFGILRRLTIELFVVLFVAAFVVVGVIAGIVGGV